MDRSICDVVDGGNMMAACLSPVGSKVSLMCFTATLLGRWRCRCPSSGGAGRSLRRHTLWCSCKWRILGKSCRSLSSHSECSQHWKAYKHKLTEAQRWLSKKTMHNSVLSHHIMRQLTLETTTRIHRATENAAGENTDLFFCSSSKFAAFHSEPWNQKRETFGRQREKEPARPTSLSLSTHISQKEEVTVTYNILVKAHFLTFPDPCTRKASQNKPKNREIAHQIEIIKYFGGLVHLCHGNQDLVVNVLLVRSHVEAYPRLQGRVHLRQSRGKLRSHRLADSRLFNSAIMLL